MPSNINKFFFLNFSMGGYVILPTFDPCIFCGGNRDFCGCCCGCGASALEKCDCEIEALNEAVALAEWKAEQEEIEKQQEEAIKACLAQGIDPLGVCGFDEDGCPF